MSPVVVIGLDAADPHLVQRGIALGELPHLARLRERGQWRLLTGADRYRAETPWTTFLTGHPATTVGYWGPIHYAPEAMTTSEVGAYDFEEFPPFYSRLSGGVCVFDMPQTRLVDGLAGLQVLGWGSHSQQGPSQSRPAGLLRELQRTWGAHPAYGDDHANAYDAASLRALWERLRTGLTRRTAIATDLIRRQRWQLYLEMVGETHSGGHSLWHLGGRHPLGRWQERDEDAVADLYRRVDAHVGAVLAAAPDDARIAVFAAHGMVDNVLDVPSMLFLPELLFRWAFPGRVGIGGREGSLGPPRLDHPRHWKHEVWSLVEADSGLESPVEQARAGWSLDWQPAHWYKPLWPRMRAFALPSYSDGCVRVNLAGRDGGGRVPPEELSAVLAEVETLLHGLVCGRTGLPMVDHVLRVRSDAADRSPRLPAADLVVRWAEGRVTDVVEHPQLGRIGPVPLFRTGGHRSLGFLLAAGPGVRPGEAPTARDIDLAPTILSWCGAPHGDLPGRSL